MPLKTNGQGNFSLTQAKISCPWVRRNINTKSNCPTGACFAMLALLVFGFGIYTGLHFNVLALLPLSFLGAGAFIFSSWSSGYAVSESVVSLLLPILALQAGYMIGLTGRNAYSHLRTRVNIAQSKRV